MQRFKTKYLLWLFVVSGLFVITSNAAAQQVSRRQLISALKSCERDLQKSKQHILNLSTALAASDSLLASYRSVTDSLTQNLKKRLFLQDSIARLMQMNADTLQRMVKDYSKKLAQVDRLYINELKKKSRPWFFTGNGLKGLLYGVFVGGALGLSWAVLH